MLKLDDFSRFTKTFYKVDDFNAKHIINTNSYRFDTATKKEKMVGPLYTYEINDKRVFETKKALSINTSDSIMLSNNKKTQNEKDPKGGYISILPVNFTKIMKVLREGERWLCDSEFEKLFTIDTQGNTIGLSNEKMAAIAKLSTGWLLLKPAVIFDNNGAGHQSIYMKTDRGILTTLTGEEYISFVNLMDEITINFYQASMQLYNASILSIILGGIK